jgi:hypothetical protein
VTDLIAAGKDQDMLLLLLAEYAVLLCVRHGESPN